MSIVASVGAAAIALSALGTGSPEQHGPDILELLVEVDDVSVRALCTDGPRRVLLLHGEAASADTWRPVLERLNGAVGACAYDRTGSGLGGPVPGQRGWFELEDEMRRIHAALEFRPGYTLVGHALGGMYARLFAADRPGDVGALLLVDPAHEDLPEAARSGLPKAALEAWRARRRKPNSDGVREVDLAARLRRSTLPAIPVTVITATRRRQGDGYNERFLNQAARRVHASILSGVTLGRHIPAGRSGPEVQHDQPGLVADEVLRLVRAAEVRR